MNILLLAVALTAAKMASGSYLHDMPSTHYPAHDPNFHPRPHNQPLNRVKSNQIVVSNQPVPLKIYLPLNSTKWADTSAAHLTIARIIPSQQVKTRIGDRIGTTVKKDSSIH